MGTDGSVKEGIATYSWVISLSTDDVAEENAAEYSHQRHNILTTTRSDQKQPPFSLDCHGYMIYYSDTQTANLTTEPAHPFQSQWTMKVSSKTSNGRSPISLQPSISSVLTTTSYMPFAPSSRPCQLRSCQKPSGWAQIDGGIEPGRTDQHPSRPPRLIDTRHASSSHWIVPHMGSRNQSSAIPRPTASHQKHSGVHPPGKTHLCVERLSATTLARCNWPRNNMGRCDF